MRWFIISAQSFNAMSIENFPLSSTVFYLTRRKFRRSIHTKQTGVIYLTNLSFHVRYSRVSQEVKEGVDEWYTDDFSF